MTGIAVVDFANFDERSDEIAAELWRVATDVGFFYAINHDIPQEKIDLMFETSKSFFALDRAIKSKSPYDLTTNNGWEGGTEVLDERSPDLKETYNLGYVHMEGKWPSDTDAPGFRETAEEFQGLCEQFSWKVLSSFAKALGFPPDFFVQFHDPGRDDCTKLLRLLYYPELTADAVAQFKPGQLRAGTHTDYGCVTLLFQRPGEAGLEVCPGIDPSLSNWKEVDPMEGGIVINIGDSLMRWSDDRLKSNPHRVRAPRLGDPLHARYSMAYFNQPNGFAVIQGPEKKYPPITAGDYLHERFRKTYT